MSVYYLYMNKPKLPQLPRQKNIGTDRNGNHIKASLIQL